VATVGVFIAAMFQWDATRRATLHAATAANAAQLSAEVADETLWLTQRANLSIDSWQIQDLYNEADPRALGPNPRVAFVIRNHGPGFATLDAVRSEFRVAVDTPPTWPGSSPKGEMTIAGNTGINQPMFLDGVLGPLARTRSDAGEDWWYAVRLEYHDDLGHYAYCTVVRPVPTDRKQLEIYPAPGYHCNEKTRTAAPNFPGSP
jgi:hypothetical protein